MRCCTLKGNHIASVLFCRQKEIQRYLWDCTLEAILISGSCRSVWGGILYQGAGIFVAIYSSAGINSPGWGRGIILYIQSAAEVQKINLFQ